MTMPFIPLFSADLPARMDHRTDRLRTHASAPPRTRALLPRILGAVSASLLALGCSSQPVRVGPRPSAAYEVVGPSEGGGCGLLFQGLIPIRLNSRTERAYAEAIRGKGTALINTEIQYRWWFIPYVGTLHCTIIKGTVIR